MHSHLQDSPKTASHEQEIRSLSIRTAVPPDEVRALFAHEFERLGMGAKVGSYLAVLTTSNVRAMLRRKGKGAGEPGTRDEVQR
jgi:hypothetical protein